MCFLKYFMNKKRVVIVFSLVLSLLLVGSVSAVWWNPSDWFGGDVTGEVAGGDCIFDEDCGIDEWVGNAYCFDDTRVCRLKKEFSCDGGDCSYTYRAKCNGCGVGDVCEEGLCVEGPDIECIEDGDCDEGEICLFNICTKIECEVDKDCDEGEICIGRICIEGPEVECIDDKDCWMGEICVDGECVEPPRCVNDEGCEEGEVCIDQICVEQTVCEDIKDCGVREICVEDVCVRVECVNNNDCDIGKICADNLCVEELECTVNEDCDAGEECVGGECIECSTGDDCEVGEVCVGGGCVQEPEGENEKDMSKYSNKEAFLISDRDWRAVLGLVPVTTWTGDEEDCQRATGTPDNVCVYPTLIYHGETSEICNNEIDDNGDGLIDCCDFYCEDYVGCQEICTDEEDNDCDGEIDCRDWDCDYDPACREDICDDGIDNDEDGEIDCEDWDCRWDDACIENDCDDGIDNDSDGDVDCEDRDCDGIAPCIETICDDGIDNDNDGYIDCEDWDCRWDDVCRENDCDDGIDNDEDETVDCNDADCGREDICKGVCNDSDGGLNYTFQGIISGLNIGYGEMEEGEDEIYSLVVTSSDSATLRFLDDEYDIVVGGTYTLLNYMDIYITKIKYYSDGNRDNYIEFIISGVIDICLDDLEDVFGNDLVEFYCYSDQELDAVEYRCSDGCENGACIGNKMNAKPIKADLNELLNFGRGSNLELSKYETYEPTFEPVNGRNLIRVDVLQKSPRPLLVFDIASVSRDYVDIFATQEDIEKIRLKGYKVEVLSINGFDFFKQDYAGAQYHSYEDMVSELESIEADYGSIAKLYDIGDSIEGRDILAIKISDNVETEEEEPEVLVVGNHHAREIMTVEVPIYEINYIVSHYEEDSVIKEMVDNWELWFVPMVNPDGHVRVEEGNIFWRKNTRDNGDGTFGVDLNRNYGYTWGYDDVGSSPDTYSDSYRGASEFSEPETQAIRDLVLSHEFDYVLDYHSYGGAILYPWGHILDSTEDDNVFYELAQQMRTFVPNYIAGQISDIMYYSNGDSIGWHYGEQEAKNKILAFGFELNSYEEGLRPPANLIKPTSEKHLLLLGDLLGYDIEVEQILENSFDADSIIYFMQQYSPDKITIIGESPQELDDLLIAEPEVGGGFDEEQLQRIFPQDYLSYWDSSDTVVYVENNYETALIASTYASLINAPLIIKDYNDEIDLSGKEVICVGSVDIGCDSTYDLEGLQARYLELTDTDKIILVNPNDLNIFGEDVLYPEKSGGTIIQLYGKTSLGSAFLASAKHELIIESFSFFYQEVDELIENKILSLDINPEYLTIFASPDAIDMYDDYGREPDFRIYSDLDDNPISSQSELAVGRIMGITLSDVSSLVARTLFYEQIKPDNTGFLMIQRGDPPNQRIPMMTCGEGFCKCYFDVECEELFPYADYFDSSDYCDETICDDYPCEIECDNRNEELIEQLYDSTFAMYGDHGGPDQWVETISSHELEDLPPLFAYSFACSTCAYGYVKADLFCTNMIRKGAIGYIGANNLMSGHHFLDEFLEEAFDNENTIGQAFKVGKNKERIGDWEVPSSVPIENYGSNDVLIGDPTFNGGNLK